MTLKVLSLLSVAGGIMAQTPTAKVHDYLKEVRILPPGSPEFAQIASKLGVDATLSTLGQGASLVVAIRNDSGHAIDSMRILYDINKGGTPIHRLQHWGSLAAGEAILFGPMEIAGPIYQLQHSQPQMGMITNMRSAQPLDFYQGSEVTFSVDSASLANGKFVGADTQGFFPKLVERDARVKAFFSDLAKDAKTLSVAQLNQQLTAGKAASDAARFKPSGPIQPGGPMADRFSLADQELSGMYQVALATLESGLPSLAQWADRENSKQQSKPTLHK
jgi:hypothetical protein